MSNETRTKRSNLTGKRFTRLLVLSLLPELGTGGRRYWRCSCDCGAITKVSTSKLNDGSTKSCGCYAADQLRKQRITHGESNKTSEYKVGFIVEWLFEKALVEAILQEESHEEYIQFIKSAAENANTQIQIMRGLIRAIQKDFSFLASHPTQKMQENNPSLLEKAMSLTQNIFPILVTLAKKDNNFVSKYIANWAVEMPLQNEESRFFKRFHWRWIRTLAAHIWDASLREPPTWVVEGGSNYCATIFQTAPALWLRD